MNDSSHTPSLSYRDAGVDIDAGNRLVDRLKAVTAATHRPEVMGGIGGFGALVEIPEGYHQPVLVSGTDGVGTKLRLAMMAGRHDSIGIDLVAMCSNDIAVVGAEPLLFLDYYATGKLDVDVATDVVTGIGKGCELAGCALVGGETAEMPGMYEPGDFDLAGFAVGAMERGAELPAGVREGDMLIGLASDGVHSNGYSLVRRIVERSGLAWDAESPFGGDSLGRELLAPTRLYVKQALAAVRAGGVHALAHITGGGLTENLPRVLPEGLGAEIDLGSWTLPPVFGWLMAEGGLDEKEMLKTFNSGIGMVVVVAADRADALVALLEGEGETVARLGTVVAGEGVRYSGSLA